MATLVLGLILFLGSHTLTRFRSLRDGLETKMGAMPFKGLYSIVALIGFVLIIIGYGQYRAGGYIEIWSPPAFLTPLAYLLMMPVFVFLIAAYAPGRIKSAIVYPMLAAVQFWALAHVLVNGDLGSMLLFGGFLAWGIFARARLGKAARLATTWSLGDTIAVAGGIGGWATMLMWLHPILIGVSAIA